MRIEPHQHAGNFNTDVLFCCNAFEDCLIHHRQDSFETGGFSFVFPAVFLCHLGYMSKLSQSHNREKHFSIGFYA